MVKKTDGLNRIRDLINSDISSGIHGTDGTDPTASNAAPGSGVSSSIDSDMEITTGNQTANITHVLPATSSNGNVLKEFVIRINGDADPLFHVVYPDFNKKNSIELQTVTTYRVE